MGGHNEEHNSERSDEVSPYLMVACAQVPVRKFKERLPTACIYLIKLFLLPLCICLRIEVSPSHTTNPEPISTLVKSVEAPYFALHPRLPASKTVLSSWSLAVICALIARGKFKPELEFQAGTSAYFHFRAGTSSYYALYKHENIGYAEVPEDNLCNTYAYEYLT